MIYYKMDGLSIIASAIIAIIALLILLSPFILSWIVYSYIFSKLIYSFAKRYFNLNISFSRTWTITCLSGMTSFIIILIFIFLHSSYSVSVAVTTITVDISKLEFISIEKYLEMLTAIIVTVFIASLIAYKYLSNVNLRVAIVMSFVTLLAYLTFIIIVISVVLYIFWYIYIYPWSTSHNNTQKVFLALLFNIYLY